MTNYDLIQAELVIQSEKPHEYGLRDKGMSGRIVQELFKQFLRSEFPHYHMDEGIACSLNNKTEFQQQGTQSTTSKFLSPQVDILFYSGKEWERITDYVVVQRNRVHCVLEVKKWDQKIDSLREQIQNLEAFFSCPILLVVFRSTKRSFKIIKEEFGENSFIFSTATPSDYPDYIPLGDWLINGELQRLVTRINKEYDNVSF